MFRNLAKCHLRLGSFASLLVLLFSATSYGQISFTGEYTQNFNSFAGTTASMPTGWSYAGNPTAQNGTGTGSSATGGLWGYGSSGEFALGYLHSGSTTPNGSFTATFTNNTGATITALTITYDFEQWRGQGNATGFSSVTVNSSSVSSLTATGSGTTFTSGGPIVTAKSASLTSLSIANGATITIVWTANDISGADNGIAIDNFKMCVTGKAFTATAGSNSPVTAPAAINLTGSASSGTASYSYSWAGPSYSSATQNPTITPSSTANIGNYTLTVTDAIGCTAITTTTVNVLCTTPTAYSVTGTGGYCSGGSGVAVGLENSQTGINYQLYRGATTVGIPVVGSTGSSISFGLQTVAGTYTVLATNTAGGCTNAMTGSAVITINTLPSIEFTPSAPSLCSGGAGVALTASGASTYTWTPTSTLSSSTGATVTANPPTNTVYTVTGTSAAGCTGIGTISVSVNPLPIPTISGSATIPVGGSAVLTFGGNENDTVYYWNGTSTVSTIIPASGTSTVSVSPASTTVYSITSATSAYGCSQAIAGETATITVSSLPSASISGTGSVCPGGNTNLVFSGTAGATVYYNTDGTTPLSVILSGTSGIGTYTLNVTPTVATIYTLDSIVSGSYHGTISGSATVSIYILPSPYTVTGGGSYCSGGTGLAVGLGNSQTDVTYQLYNGASTVGSPVAGTGSSISFGTFTASGTYTVLATDDITTCTTNMTGSATISINSRPAITFIGTNGPVCQGAILQLNAAISNTTAPYTYSWSGSSSFSSSVSSSALTNTVSTGAIPSSPSTPSYTLIVTDANGCTSTGANTVSTTVTSFTAGTISGTTSVFIGTTTTLTSSGTSGGAWSSSDVSSATIGSLSGIVIGVATGTARITYAVTNSCGTVIATANVTISALAPTSITSNAWSGTTSSTSTASDPTAFPTLPSAAGVAFSQWRRGAGLGATTGGSYNSNSFNGTTLATAQSGNDYVYFTVTNDGNTEVKLTQLFLQTQVSSSGPTSTQLLYKIGSGAEQIFSTVQATSTSGSASTETYDGAACLPPGTVTEFRLYGWGGTAAGTFRVNAGTTITGSYVSGVTAFGATSVSNSSPVCSGSTIMLSGTPSNGAPPYTYSWSGPSSFSSTLQNPTTPAVTAAGTYSLNVTDQMGCSAAMATTTTTVNANPVAINGLSTVCIAAMPTYTNTTSGGSWISSDPSIATIHAATGLMMPQLAGVATITYQVVSTGCYALKTVTITSMPGGITGAASACVGGSTTLGNSATGGTWSSTNTTVGSIGSSSGTVSALAAGTTTISYVLAPGCEASAVFTVNATPTAAPANSGPICVGGTVTLSANPGGSATTYTWSGPSLSSTSIANPTATPTATATYSLTVTNGTGDAGCAPATVYTTVVTVRPAPTAAPSNNGYICVGGTVSLTANPASGANTFNWTGIALSSASSATPTATPTSTTVYSLTVSDGTGDNGCAPATVYTTSVTVNSTPTAAPTNSGAICNGGTVNLAANGSGGATAYTWSGIALASTTVANPTATPTGTATYSLTVSDGSTQPGCAPATVYTTSVTVNSTPTAAPANSGPICVGGTVTLSANPGGSATTYAWSGPSLSSTTVANPTATPTATATYSLTVTNGTSDAGCAPATVYTTVVTVRPAPTAAPSNNGYICVGGTVSLTANPANGANTFNWTGVALSSASSATPTATPTSITVYSLTVSDGTGDNGCAPATVYTTSVTVNSTPTAAPTNSGPICNGGTVNLAANGSGGATAYTWSGIALASTTVANPTATPTGTATYSLTVSDGSTQPGCAPATVYTTSVTVNSTPTAAPANSGPICVGGTVTLSANPGGSATTYAWSGPSLSSTTVANPTATPTATATYSLTVTNGTSDAGCAPATVYTTIVTVRPAPTAAPSNNGYICVGGTVSLAANPANGANTFNWTGVALSSPSSATPTATPTSTTVYSLTVSDGTGDNGCAPATVYTTSVTVNSTPTAAPTNSGPTCDGGTITLISNASGGTTVYMWSGPALSSATVANPTAMPSVTSVYSLAVSDGSGRPGCSPATVYTTSVTVNSISAIVPTVVSSGGSTICQGESSTLATTGADSYIWVPSTGLSSNTGASLTATPSVTTTYTVTGAKDGCTNIAVVMVSVNPIPANITGPTEVCKTETVVLSSATSGGMWSSDNASVASVVSATGQVLGTGGGATTITYTKDGCSTSRSMTVHAPAAITSTGYASICIGQTYALGHPETGGVWSSSANAIATASSAGLVTGIDYGTVTITYTTTLGCNLTKQVTIGMPAPINGTPWACLNSTVDLDHSEAGGTWSSSNPARATVDATTGVVYGASLGNFYITYTLFPGCYRAMEMAVQTFPLDISGTMSICQGASANLANETASGTWSSSDTTVASIAINSGTAIGLSGGTTNITYKFQGCYNVEVLTVNALPSDVTGANELCEGSSATYVSLPAGGTWSSSNPSRAAVGLSSGIATGVSAGSVLLTFASPAGCRKTKTILINPRPGILSGIANICAGNSTTLTSMSDGGTWSSSDVMVATVGTSLAWSTAVTGLAAGTTNVVVSSPQGCTRSVVVTVNAAASAISGNAILCPGGTSLLSNAAPSGSWSSSASSVATVNSTGLVTGMAPGTATITFAASAYCIATKQVTVNNMPGAILGPNNVCTGNMVTLTHADAGGSWVSTTPGRATVDAATGQVTGISAGVAFITYNIGFGCMKATTINVNPLPAAIAGASTICQGSISAFTNTTTGGTWTSSNTSVAVVPSSPGNVTGVGAGAATITYMIPTTSCYTTRNLTVNAQPSPISGTNQLCIGAVNTYTSSSTGMWSSSMPSRASVDAVSGQVTGISTGSATLTYTVASGCYRTLTISVNPLPVAIGGTAVVCKNATTTLNDITIGGTWSSSDPSIAAIAATGVVTGVNAGMVNITYKLTATGCQATRQLTVNALPSPISGIDQVCVGSTQGYLSSPTGGTWTSGATAKATINGTSGIATGVAQGVAMLTYVAPTTGCSVMRQISVNPVPAAITGSTTTVCVGNSISLSSFTASQTWTGSGSAITIAPSGATTAIVTGISEGVSIVSYVNAYGCASRTTVNVSPAVAPITGDRIVCPTRTVQLNTAATGGTWSSALATRATVNSAGLVTGVNSGNVNISYIVSPGCNTVANVTVNPAPSAITGPAFVCIGDSIDLNHALTGGTWSATGPLASVNAANGYVTGVAAGTPSITYSINSGCWVTTTVNVRPTPAPITGGLTVAVGTTSMLANATPAGTWSSSATGIASIASSGLMTGIAPGNATITYRVTATQCFATALATVTGVAGKAGQIEVVPSVKVYPNPTNGRLLIEASVEGVFTVHSLDGKLLERYQVAAPSTAISFPRYLVAGVYMCRFEGADGSQQMLRIVYTP